MLLTVLFSTLNFTLCNSRVAGACPVESCGKTGDGMCGLVGDALSTGSPPELHWQVGISLTGQPNGDHSALTSLFGSLAKTVLPHLVITLTKLIL